MSIRKVKRQTSIKLAQNLRRRQTDEEEKLWHALRSRRFSDFKFRRQQIVGRYIADFLCVGRRLIVEADGSHHSVEMDKVRDEFLRKSGYRALRFSNYEIKTKFDMVTDQIWLALHNVAYDPDAEASG